MDMPQRLGFMVVERIERTIRIAELRLRPLGTAIEHRPGQHVLVYGPGPAAASAARPYAVANAVRPDGELTLLVTRQPGGALSTWLHETAWPGRCLELSGPYGAFGAGVLDDDAPLLCLAAGSGLAPMLALLETVLPQERVSPVTLLFSARSGDEVFCRGLLAYWERRYGNFHFSATLTQRSATGNLHGRLPQLLPELFDSLAPCNVLAAGATEFVEACAGAALRLGARADRVHTEGYVDQCDDVVIDLDAAEHTAVAHTAVAHTAAEHTAAEHTAAEHTAAMQR